jgi:hypothetical protein
MAFPRGWSERGLRQSRHRHLLPRSRKRGSILPLPNTSSWGGQTNKQQTLWPESASELYRPSDRRFSAKLVATFADSGWRGQCDGSLRPYSRLSRPQPLHFLPSSSSIVLTRLSGSRFRPITSQKIWQRRESNPNLWICSQEL